MLLRSVKEWNEYRDANPEFVPYLRGVNLTLFDLTGANFRDANLIGADLWRACLQRADLTGANLGCANTTDADFEGAILDGTIGLPDHLKPKQK